MPNSNKGSDNSNAYSKTALQFCRFSFHAMGSPCDIRFYAADVVEAASTFKHVVQDIVELENKYSRYKSESLLSKVNVAANQGASIDVDDEFLALLSYANACFEQSDGLFDVTSGVLRELWDFSTDAAIEIPSSEQIESVLERIGWRHVVIKDHTVSFAKKGMAIDFGGIVKEYAADCSAKKLVDQGVQFGLVNLGGDIKAVGPHPDGCPWNVKIRDPKVAGKHVAEIPLYHEGLATSGDYERCVEIEGQRYSHLLSPKTGWPVAGLSSVSVKAPQCVVAGSAATIAMLKGNQGKAWLESLGVEYHLISG